MCDYERLCHSPSTEFICSNITIYMHLGCECVEDRNNDWTETILCERKSLDIIARLPQDVLELKMERCVLQTLTNNSFISLIDLQVDIILTNYIHLYKYFVNMTSMSNRVTMQTKYEDQVLSNKVRLFKTMQATQ